MDIRLLWSKCRFHLPKKGGVPARMSHDMGSIKLLQLIGAAIATIVMVTGCATTPHVQPADPQLLFKSELLAFIQDGVTTREEVVVKLGIPSAQFEGEKILMYQLRADQTGKWHLIAPQINTSTGFRAWREGTVSLVLVFGGHGVLRRHSLVTAQ